MPTFPKATPELPILLPTTQPPDTEGAPSSEHLMAALRLIISAVEGDHDGQSDATLGALGNLVLRLADIIHSMGHTRLEQQIEELKVLVEALTKSVKGLKEDIQGVKEGVQGVKEDVQGLKEDVQGMKEDIQGVKEDVQGMKIDIQGVKEDVQGVKEDVQGVKEDVQGVKVDIQGVKDDVQGVKEDIRAVKEDAKMLLDRVSSLGGLVQDIGHTNKLHNRLTPGNWRPVLNKHGIFPASVGLPRLQSEESVGNLTQVELLGFLVFYELPGPNVLHDRGNLADILRRHLTAL